MDAIDLALLHAWNRLSPATRTARLHAPSPARPARPRCLALRASDTRLLNFSPAHADPDSTTRHRTLLLTLTADELRHLTAPVHINWPGIPWTAAARRLGRHPESLRSLITRGVFRVRYQNAVSLRARGKPIPIVWSPSPLDPAAHDLKHPDPHWGTLWLTAADRIPDDFIAHLRLTPRLRPYRSRGSTSLRFRGRDFTCPACETTTSKLFLPLSNADFRMLISSGGGLSARPTSSIPSSVPPTLLCHHCCNIRYQSLAARSGWHDFIHAISGGLLSGHEVTRPAHLTTTRKKARSTQKPRAAPTRARLITLLLNPATAAAPAKSLAATLRIRLSTLNTHLKKLHRLHHVHTRQALLFRLQILYPAKSKAITPAG